MKNAPFAAPARHALASFQRSGAGLERDGAAVAPSSLAPGLTLRGTEDADSLTGGAFDDVLDGRGGADLLTGGAGNDILLGGSGNDTLNGQAGIDLLDGGDGNDTLYSDYIEDARSGPLAPDTLLGGQGDDFLAGTGNSFLDGGAGNDYLTARGNDTIVGGSGNDGIFVIASNSATPVLAVIDAGAGDDILSLQIGTATMSLEITGGSGSDFYSFFPGIHAENTVFTDFQTGIGGDQIELRSIPQYDANPFGAAGYVRLVQSGSDTLFQVDEDGAVGAAAQFHTLATLRGVKASDFHAANFGGGSNPSGLEVGRYNVGNYDNNFLVGKEFDDTLSGGGGSDTLTGAEGNDVLYGGVGGDDLDGGNGSDTLDGGAGENRLSGDDGDDQLTCGSGKDTLDGGLGNDQLAGGDGDDELEGGWGDDTLLGGNGNDLLAAGSGSDLLDGGAGDDQLRGWNGNAQLNGGSGNDRLSLTAYGDSGMFGGTGNDVFDIYSASGRVVAMGGAGDDTIILRRTTELTGAVTASGGEGVDTYQLLGKERTGSLILKDFAAGAGGDRIDVKALLKTPLQFDALVTSGVLRVEQSGTSTLVQLDTDGNAGAGSAYTLMTLQNVVASTVTADNFLTGATPVQLIGLALDPVHAV